MVAMMLPSLIPVRPVAKPQVLRRVLLHDSRHRQALLPRPDPGKAARGVLPEPERPPQLADVKALLRWPRRFGVFDLSE